MEIVKYFDTYLLFEYMMRYFLYVYQLIIFLGMQFASYYMLINPGGFPMKNPKEYNQYIQSLELQAKEGMLFHRIEQFIFITDHQHRLIGVWDLQEGKIAEEKIPLL